MAGFHTLQPLVAVVLIDEYIICKQMKKDVRIKNHNDGKAWRTAHFFEFRVAAAGRLAAQTKTSSSGRSGEAAGALWDRLTC